MSTVLAPLRRALHASTRWAPARAAAMGGMEALCEAAARLLMRSRWVHAVYVRGSYVRGGFRPFISDVDLALLVREPPAGLAYEACRSVHRRLRAAGVVNPFVRDVWQTILTEPQWPLAGKYGALMGTAEWRLIAGDQPWSGSQGVPGRLRLAAAWNRQHFWTITAVHDALASGRVQERALKKARSFGEKVAPAPAGEAAVRGTTNGLWLNDVAAALEGLAASARHLVAALELELPQGAPVGGEPEQGSAAEDLALRVLERAFDLDAARVSVFGGRRTLVLAYPDDAALGVPEALLDAARDVFRKTEVVAVPYSATALAMAPLRDRPRLLRPPREHTPVAVAEPPLLIAEQLLYEGLYAATNLWVAAGRGAPRADLETHVAGTLELYRFFLTGELRRCRRALDGELAELLELDPSGAQRFGNRRGLERMRTAPSEASHADLFEAGSAVAARLAELLLAFDAAEIVAPSSAAVDGS